MNFEKGEFVKSTMGRDIDNIYIVMDVVGDKILLVDGKQRKTENPKKKNIKHISKLNVKSTLICDRIKCSEKIPNSLIRKEIERIKQ